MPEFEPRYGPRAWERIATLAGIYILGMSVTVIALVLAVTIGASTEDADMLGWILGFFVLYIPAAFLAAATMYNSVHSDTEARNIRTALANGHTWNEIGAASGLGVAKARRRLRSWATERDRFYRKGIADGINSHEYAVVLAYLNTGDDQRPETPAATGPIAPPGKPDPRWEALSGTGWLP